MPYSLKNKEAKKKRFPLHQGGPEAGQTVELVHVRVLPRKKGDFFEHKYEVYKALDEHDKQQIYSGTGDKGFMTAEEMAKEAAHLAGLFWTC